jgi:N-acetylmuramoyl-L-alanine amidase-like protein
VRRPAIAVALLAIAIALAAGCGRAERSATGDTAPAATAAPSATTSEAERNAQRDLEGAEANAAANTQATTPKPARTQTAQPHAAKPPAAARPTAARPAIVQRPIPFGSKRRDEMRAYALRHYGIDDFHLRNPKVIVEHYTATDTLEAAYATFADDVPDAELHELPATCAHFIVDKDGTIYQLVSLTIMCRHTVGLNWTAVGIEQVGLNAREIVNRRAQYTSVLRLTAWLRCRYAIAVGNVIGHGESLSSPYHHENVAALRRQTHADWTHAEMTPVRARLGRYRCRR